MPRMRGPGRHGTRLPRRMVRRFGGGSAADPMKVRRGRSDPERLAEMSRLILDRMTGREPPAGAEGLPVGRKALRRVPPFAGMLADIGGRRRTVIAADASPSTGHDRTCGRTDAAQSFGAESPSVETPPWRPSLARIAPGPFSGVSEPPCPLGQNPDAPCRGSNPGFLPGSRVPARAGNADRPASFDAHVGPGAGSAVSPRRAGVRPPGRAYPRLR